MICTLVTSVFVAACNLWIMNINF